MGEIIKIINAKIKKNNTKKIRHKFSHKNNIIINKRSKESSKENINFAYKMIKRNKIINNKIKKNIKISKKGREIVNALELIESELNSLSYKEALKKDKRTY